MVGSGNSSLYKQTFGPVFGTVLHSSEMAELCHIDHTVNIVLLLLLLS